MYIINCKSFQKFLHSPFCLIWLSYKRSFSWNTAYWPIKMKNNLFSSELYTISISQWHGWKAHLPFWWTPRGKAHALSCNAGEGYPCASMQSRIWSKCKASRPCAFEHGEQSWRVWGKLFGRNCTGTRLLQVSCGGYRCRLLLLRFCQEILSMKPLCSGRENRRATVKIRKHFITPT